MNDESRWKANALTIIVSQIINELYGMNVLGCFHCSEKVKQKLNIYIYIYISNLHDGIINNSKYMMNDETNQKENGFTGIHVNLLMNFIV